MKTLGQIACETYVVGRYNIKDNSDWWQKLPISEREAWEAVASAVKFHVGQNCDVECSNWVDEADIIEREILTPSLESIRQFIHGKSDDTFTK